jgi:hypothetical protein
MKSSRGPGLPRSVTQVIEKVLFQELKRGIGNTQPRTHTARNERSRPQFIAPKVGLRCGNLLPTPFQATDQRAYTRLVLRR